MNRRLIGALLLTTALAAGCGDDGDDSDADGDATPPPTSEATTTTEDETEEPADLPASTVEDWAGLVTEASSTNGLDWYVQQIGTAVECLPADNSPTCALGAVSGEHFADLLGEGFAGALGEGDSLNQVEPLGEPPAEIADLVTRTREAAEGYEEAVSAMTGSGGGTDCTQSNEGACTSVRTDVKKSGQTLLDVIAEWEPHLG